MEIENRMISAEWLKAKCYEICDEYNTEHLYIDRIIDEIDNAPDVEVVRCKDCKRGRGFSIDRYECSLDGELWCKDDFCSYGERRTDERKAD